MGEGVGAATPVMLDDTMSDVGLHGYFIFLVLWV
jgi:hypothetical protein